MPPPITSAQIVNFSEFEPGWNWVAHRYAKQPEMQWLHVSTRSADLPHWLPRRHTWQRIAAARTSHAIAARPGSVLVSHGPRLTMYGSLADRGSAPVPHLAYAFNYTELPIGALRRVQAFAFRRVARFTVFSTMERWLYAEHFGIDPSRIDMIHWAVAPPQASARRLVNGDYVCAIGSQGRDYRVLIRAMNALPSVRMVIVATPEAMQGVGHVPPNVDVRLEVPLAEAMNILAHSRFMVLPLSGNEVPCGHVTLVSAMHLGKAIVATASRGISDYLQDGINARLADPFDDAVLASRIAELAEAPAFADRLGHAGQAFARAHCTEDHVVAYFSGVLPGLLLSPG